MSKLKNKPTIPEVSDKAVEAAGKAIADRWEAKANAFHGEWMAKLEELRGQHPDYPEGALMQLSLKAVRLEAETKAREQERFALQANASALAEHMESVGLKQGWKKRQRVLVNERHKDNHADLQAVEAWIRDNGHLLSNNQTLIADRITELKLVSQSTDTIRKWAGEYLRANNLTKRGRPRKSQ